MPSLSVNEVTNLIGVNSCYKTFIETGTYQAETAVAMSKHFNLVHTIEIDNRLVLNAKSKYGNLPIVFHNGDSVEVFKELLPSIKEPSVFWLDGHWSAGYDAGKGPKDCPLLDELELIVTLFNSNTLVIIDDCRLFGTKIVEDWRDITYESIMNIVSPRILTTQWFSSNIHPKDRLAIWLSPK